MSTSFYDVSIWEEIRSIVSWKPDRLVENIHKEILKDPSLVEFQGKHPVPFQLREIMEQRANAWIQRLYYPCCDAYKSRGKTVSAEFDRAVWFYGIEPFIMGETDSQIHSGTMGGFLNLLLCAVGSPPEKRPSLTLSQKHCCFDVRTKVYESWYDKLHHLPPRINEAAAVMAQASARQRRAARIVAGLPPDDPPPPPSTRADPLARPEESTSPKPSNSDNRTPPSTHRPKPAEALADLSGDYPRKEQHPPLPPKISDYSNLLDPAGLTESQRECFSLRYEYQIPAAEVARRLGRDRKTIQEHLDAANNKIKLTRNKERAGKRLARFGLDKEFLDPQD